MVALIAWSRLSVYVAWVARLIGEDPVGDPVFTLERVRTSAVGGSDLDAVIRSVHNLQRMRNLLTHTRDSQRAFTFLVLTQDTIDSLARYAWGLIERARAAAIARGEDAPAPARPDSSPV